MGSADVWLEQYLPIIAPILLVSVVVVIFSVPYTRNLFYTPPDEYKSRVHYKMNGMFLAIFITVILLFIAIIFFPIVYMIGGLHDLHNPAIRTLNQSNIQTVHVK
jgi:hypothetical protein